MWLLTVVSHQLKYFEGQIPPHAILSHRQVAVWSTRADRPISVQIEYLVRIEVMTSL